MQKAHFLCVLPVMDDADMSGRRKYYDCIRGRKSFDNWRCNKGTFKRQKKAEEMNNRNILKGKYESILKLGFTFAAAVVNMEIFNICGNRLAILISI